MSASMIYLSPLSSLLLAMVGFVGGHFILSSRSLRVVLIARIGEGGFRGVYSLVVAAFLVWGIYAYGRAPVIPVWDPGPAAMLFAHLVMPLACILLVAALTTRNPAAVGGERLLEDPKPVTGIITITRHPMLWGILLWAVGHLVANGDLADVILFASLGILALGGMFHIDSRRRHTAGPAWGPMALTTGLAPFQAALQGRVRIDWAGIGLWRVAGGLVLYVVLLAAHPWIAGVTVMRI